MTEIDWRVCPNCGEELEVVSEELIAGYSSITMEPDNHTGDLVAVEWGGDTDMLWDTTATSHYLCRCCYEKLPEAMQQVLDDLLHNERWEITWTLHGTTSTAT